MTIGWAVPTSSPLHDTAGCQLYDVARVLGRPQGQVSQDPTLLCDAILPHPHHLDIRELPAQTHEGK